MEKVRSSKINVSWNDMGIFMILALLIVILSVIRPVFLTPDNIINVIRQVTIVAIIGIGTDFRRDRPECGVYLRPVRDYCYHVPEGWLWDDGFHPSGIMYGGPLRGNQRVNPCVCKNPVFYRDHGHAERCQGHCPCHYQFLFHHRAP